VEGHLKECRNLLVPVCVPATHVAIRTIRMEPACMVLGHSAGVAAAMAAKSGKPVQELDIPALAKKLAAERQVLDRGDAIPSTQDR
jgi:malonyl CoA-acyl carrier protein transacylase